ncbi:MAG: DHH family phosphoesterase [Candidatus Micrarchaeia archaeon]|jgi:nanoRNase/pAp phosphatase (c-di-AMP/oligoRNAs hydrolase)
MPEKALQELKALKGRTLISAHSLADADALASAFAAAKIVPGAVVAFPDKPAAHATKIAEATGLKIRLLKKGELNEFDNAVLVDVSTSSLLGSLASEFEEFAHKKKLVVIDHHLHSKKIPGAKCHVLPNRSSCSEILHEMLKKNKTKKDWRTALLLAAGILSDTAFLKSANSSSYAALGELLAFLESKDWNYEKVRSLVLPRPDLSQRIAVLKALSSARVYSLEAGKHKFVAAVAQSHAFELQCAAALTEAGADYAFVGNDHEGRISGVKAEGMQGASIGKLMEIIGKAMRGSGGGHDFVGGAKGSPELVARALSECVNEAAAFHGARVKQIF